MLAGGPSVLLLFTVILSLGNLEKLFFPSIIFIVNGFLKPSTVCAPGATPKRETWGPWGRLRFVFHKGQEKWHNPLFDSFLSVYVQSRRNGFTLPFNSLESPSASALLRFLIFLPTPLNQSGVADCANGSEQGRQRTKSHNIFPQWQLKKKKKRFHRNAICHSLTWSAVAFWMSLPVPLRWPSLLPFIKASVGAEMESLKRGIF